MADASIILAWLLPDEKEDKVNQLFSTYRKQKNKIYSPKLLAYELMNGLKSAILQKRIDRKEAQAAIDVFRQMTFQLIDQEGDERKILRLAEKLNLSVYDASYVVLARKLKVKLLSLDKKLQSL